MMTDHPATLRPIFFSQGPDTKSLYQQHTALFLVLMLLELGGCRKSKLWLRGAWTSWPCSCPCSPRAVSRGGCEVPHLAGAHRLSFWRSLNLCLHPWILVELTGHTVDNYQL